MLYALISGFYWANTALAMLPSTRGILPSENSLYAVVYNANLTHYDFTAHSTE